MYSNDISTYIYSIKLGIAYNIIYTYSYIILTEPGTETSGNILRSCTACQNRIFSELYCF